LDDSKVEKYILDAKESCLQTIGKLEVEVDKEFSIEERTYTGQLILSEEQKEFRQLKGKIGSELEQELEGIVKIKRAGTKSEYSFSSQELWEFDEELFEVDTSSVGFDSRQIPVEEAVDESILEESRNIALAQGLVGPRTLPEWEFRDVEDKGNCFYLAVVDQLKKIEHPFIQGIPESTQNNDSLRLLIQGENFRDQEWADHTEILALSKKLGIIVAIGDTLHPNNGFLYHYMYDEKPHYTAREEELPSDMSIIKLAYTSLHYMSVLSHPALTNSSTVDEEGVATLKRSKSNAFGERTGTSPPEAKREKMEERHSTQDEEGNRLAQSRNEGAERGRKNIGFLPMQQMARQAELAKEQEVQQRLEEEKRQREAQAKKEGLSLRACHKIT
jgi:hypothetical protein